VGRGNVKRVIVAFPHGFDDARMTALLRTCTAHGVRIETVPRFWELAGPDASVSALGNMALLEVGAMTPGRTREVVKRAFDVLSSALGLLVLSPVLAAAAIAIRLDDPGPVLFRQTRVGRDGREFDIFKFRSMRVGADDEGTPALAAVADADGATPLGAAPIKDLVAALKPEDDPRVTRVGRVLRRTSIDELPQLWNVLRGDMSVVGPRPLRPFEVAALTDWQRRRHDVRPGITGTWQVLGRSDVDWDERMQMDYLYARRCSLRQDLRVLARTASVVLGGRGSR
jgi:exopolysaccharide biosynthesis polyprenyl glycosylphosphotransferase